MIAICPYCLREHHTDVVNAFGQCPTVSCCGETHCVEKDGPLDPTPCISERCHLRKQYLQDMLAQALMRNQLLIKALKDVATFANLDEISHSRVMQILHEAKGWYGPKHFGGAGNDKNI